MLGGQDLPAGAAYFGFWIWIFAVISLLFNPVGYVYKGWSHIQDDRLSAEAESKCLSAEFSVRHGHGLQRLTGLLADINNGPFTNANRELY